MSIFATTMSRSRLKINGIRYRLYVPRIAVVTREFNPWTPGLLEVSDFGAGGLGIPGLGNTELSGSAISSSGSQNLSETRAMFLLNNGERQQFAGNRSKNIAKRVLVSFR